MVARFHHLSAAHAIAAATAAIVATPPADSATIASARGTRGTSAGDDAGAPSSDSSSVHRWPFHHRGLPRASRYQPGAASPSGGDTDLSVTATALPLVTRYVYSTDAMLLISL